MTRPARAWRAFIAPSAAAAGITAALAFPRLPPAAESFIPRHAGFWLVRAAMAVAGRPWGAGAFAVFTAACLVAGAAAAAWPVWPRTRSSVRALRGRGFGVLAGRLAAGAVGVLVIAAACRLACSLFVEVIENAWFFSQSADLREPLALWLSLALCLALGLRTAAGFWTWILGERPDLSAAPAWAAPGAVLLCAWLSFGGFAAWRWDEARPSLGAAAGFVASTPRRRRVVVLVEDGGKPSPELHVVDFAAPGEIDYGENNLAAAEAYVRRGSSVWRLAALRYLYGGQTLQMDAGALRRALSLGAGLGDGLAAATLAENLAQAPLTQEDSGLLESLADERRYRIGARAAASLAKAYRRFAQADRADYWEKRAADGDGAVAPGLLPRPGAAARPGVIEGAAFPWQGARAALYSRPPEGEPVSLGPARLVASSPLPASGRFDFRALSEGEYFLALAFEVPVTAPGAFPEVTPAPGWLTLAKGKGRVDLAPLRVRWKAGGVREASER